LGRHLAERISGWPIWQHVHRNGSNALDILVDVAIMKVVHQVSAMPYVFNVDVVVLSLNH
jgi:hypothetical protein